MKARYKSPGANGVIELPDDATVGQLFAAIESKVGQSDFIIKYGWPLRTLDASQKDAGAKSLGLHGETLTIVLDDAASQERPATSSPQDDSSAPSATAAKTKIELKPSRPVQRSLAESPEDITVPWPEREGTLCMILCIWASCSAPYSLRTVLRVMPSDNSCLFTAFGGALEEQPSAQKLRKMVADHVLANPEEYNEGILGAHPEEYSRTIQGKDRWGGAIELSIFSNIFNLEICTFDVKVRGLQHPAPVWRLTNFRTGTKPRQLR